MTEENDEKYSDANRNQFECANEVKEYTSPIFITPKADGGIRMILNLTQ